MTLLELLWPHVQLTVTCSERRHFFSSTLSFIASNLCHKCISKNIKTTIEIFSVFQKIQLTQIGISFHRFNKYFQRQSYYNSIVGNSLFRLQKFIENILAPKIASSTVQVILCQMHSFLHQLTQNMTTDCSFNYELSLRKLQVKYMLSTSNFSECHRNNLMYRICT